jgi:hypothetical protein
MALAPLPPNTIQAHTFCRRTSAGKVEWTANYQVDGKPVSKNVSKQDAWNFDISNDLLVWIILEGPDNCEIVRKKGNKKYVQIDRTKTINA